MLELDGHVPPGGAVSAVEEARRLLTAVEAARARDELAVVRAAAPLNAAAPRLLRELVEENERLRRALETIHDRKGIVCPEFELCAHEGCQAAYEAWLDADNALKGEKETP